MNEAVLIDPSHPLYMHKHQGAQPCREKCKVTGQVELGSPLECEIILDCEVP